MECEKFFYFHYVSVFLLLLKFLTLTFAENKSEASSVEFSTWKLEQTTSVYSRHTGQLYRVT